MQIANFFDKLWNWIVYSSANPDKISGTVKWTSGICVTLLTVVFGFGHISFPSAEFTGLVDTTIQAIQQILLGVTALGTVVAGLRKIYLTVKTKE